MQSPTPRVTFISNESPAVVVYVTLTRPLQSTVSNRAAEEIEYACKLAEERKFTSCAELCEQSGLEHLPLGIDRSAGKSELLRFFSSQCWLKDSWTTICLPVQQKNTSFFQRINVALHRSNTNMVLSRVPIRELEHRNLRCCWEKPPL